MPLIQDGVTKKLLTPLKTAVIILASILLPASAHGQERVINILYTGAINGELEPCGCSPKTDYGGLARLSGYIRGNRELKPYVLPYVLIDAGNSMDDDTPQGRLKATALLRSFDLMGYDAVAFFKRETAFPKEFFPALIEKYGTPVVSDNAGYRRAIPIERGYSKIKISADPMDYAKDTLNILLTERPVSEVKSVRGWDIIITSSGEILEEPVKANGTVIVSGYPKGKKLGILTLGIDGRGKMASVSHRWQPLGKEIKEDAKVRKILKDYDAMVAGLSRDEDRKAVSNSPYLGAAGCAQCHQPFMESWKNTRHALAFGSLEKAGKSKDPECVKCHTVGFGEDGGFYSTSTTPALAGVQCESCHGQGRDHALDFTKPLMPVTEAVCLRCHTGGNSPEFDFPLYLERIKHK